jgi:hypothetical protein
MTPSEGNPPFVKPRTVFPSEIQYRTWLTPASIVVLCAVASYCSSFWGTFQFDDFPAIVRPSSVHSFAAWLHSLSHGLRPLLKLSYLLNWKSGAGLFGFHAVNLLIHLVNTGLVALLCGLAIPRNGRCFGNSLLAGPFLAALLFAVHPVQTEAVTYISSRSVLLMTTFYLAALASYAAGIRHGLPLVRVLGCPVLYACALLTRESAIVLPFALLLWELCIEKPCRRTLLRRQALPWLLFACFCCAAVIHSGYFALLYSISGSRPLAASFAYQTHGAAYLLSRLVRVDRLSIDPGLGFSHLSRVAAAGEAALFAVIVMAVLWLGRSAKTGFGRGVNLRQWSPLLTFGTLWFFLHTYLPYAILPRIDVLNERHMYIADAGIFCALGFCLAAVLPFLNRAFFRYAAIIVVIGACMVFTALRNLDYRSEISLWERTVAVSPDNPRAHNNLGIVFENARRYRDALREYRAAVAIEPGYERAVANAERCERIADCGLRNLD